MTVKTLMMAVMTDTMITRQERALAVEVPLDPKDTILDTNDMAERWHTTRAAILTLRSRGLTPPAFRIGKRVLWRLSDVRAFEEAQAS